MIISGVAALLRRHREDYGLRLLHALWVNLGVLQRLRRAGNRQHFYNLLQRAEPLYLLELHKHILEREAVFLQALRHALYIGLGGGGLDFLKKPPPCPPMPMMRCAMRRASKISRSSVFSPQPRELDRHAGARAHREGRASARVAVELRQHDAPSVRGAHGRVFATLTASCPVIESTTRRISVGFEEDFIVSSSRISSSSIWRRPSRVEQNHVAEVRLRVIARFARNRHGIRLARLGGRRTRCSPSPRARGAGRQPRACEGRRRRTSGLCPFDIRRAIFTVVVVLPEPWSPTIM